MRLSSRTAKINQTENLAVKDERMKITGSQIFIDYLLDDASAATFPCEALPAG